MQCWNAVVSSKSSSYRIRVTRHSWPSPWRYGGLQPLLHLAMSPHGTDGPSPIQKAAAGIGIRGSRLILVARNGRSRRLDSADRIQSGAAWDKAAAQFGKSSQPIETKWADLAPVGKIVA